MLRRRRRWAGELALLEMEMYCYVVSRSFPTKMTVILPCWSADLYSFGKGRQSDVLVVAPSFAPIYLFTKKVSCTRIYCLVLTNVFKLVYRLHLYISIELQHTLKERNLHD